MAHFYAGTFSRTINYLKSKGCCITYTAAAHSVETSRKAHLEMGIDYDKSYPHLTDPKLWERYLRGYKEADVLICPSQHSANVMRGFGCTNRIEVIPHGCDLPECVDCGGHGKWYEKPNAPECPRCQGTGIEPIFPLPNQFRLGYLGSYGPDKGVIDLLRAWAKLDYKDALLVLGGRDSNSPFIQSMIQHTGANNVVMTGWVDKVSDFYNQISVYCQSSRSEGYGCEVGESMAYGRSVICSEGVGAVDLIHCGDQIYGTGFSYPAGDVNRLAELIDHYKSNNSLLADDGVRAREYIKKYTWNIIRGKYCQLWRNLLGE